MDTATEARNGGTNGTQDDSLPFTTWMLIRLAEAARGFPDGRKKHIWVPRDGKVRVVVDDVPTSRRPADMGSYKGLEVQTLNSASGPTIKPRVVSAVITMSNGDEHAFEPDANGVMVDALFLSEAACEKFVFPYYAGQYGVEAACVMRHEYLDKDNPVVCHHPGSDPCDPDDYGDPGRVNGIAELLTVAQMQLLR